MDPLEGSIRLDELLANAGWMGALARSLVRNPADAEDIVQDTWLEALRHPPRDPAAAEGWLARVLRNFALRRYRAEGRRRAREVRAARQEPQEDAPDALHEKLEMHRLVAAEVAALGEPYRSTVLLRFFEERSAADIARIQGVPLDTVKTRLRRALAELRERLDRRHGGGGRAWRLALFPLAGLAALPEAAEAAASVGAAGAGTGAGAGAGTGAVPASLGWTILGNGGLIMSQKVFVAGAVAAVLVAGPAGFGIGRMGGSVDKETTIERFGLVSSEDHEALRARCEKAEAYLARARSDAQKAVAGKKALGAKVAALEEKAKAGAEAAGKAEEKGPPPPISFGPVADLEAVRKADWKDLAQAVAAMQGLFVEFGEKIQEPKVLSPDWQSKVEDQKMKLMALAGKVFGQVPTNATGNGEFTHPLILSNVMAGLMENAGHPFTQMQRADIASLGEDYEAEYAWLQKEYGEDTPKLEKVLDEIELKRTTMSAVQDILTLEQREATGPAQLRDRIGFDILSPLLMAEMSAQVRPVASAEAMRAALPRMATEMYGLDAAQAEAAAPLFDAWLREVEPVLGPPSPDQTGFGAGLTGSTALSTGRAQLKLIQGLLQLPGLSDASRTALLTGGVWFVPQPRRHGG
jgi:RNA polymerase sigma-70 factor (ECF subfamily)